MYNISLSLIFLLFCCFKCLLNMPDVGSPSCRFFTLSLPLVCLHTRAVHFTHVLLHLYSVTCHIFCIIVPFVSPFLLYLRSFTFSAPSLLNSAMCLNIKMPGEMEILSLPRTFFFVDLLIYSISLHDYFCLISPPPFYIILYVFLYY